MTPTSQQHVTSPVAKTLWGFFLKLLVVVVALGIYYGLDRLESWKEDRNRPLMVVKGKDSRALARGFAPIYVGELEEALGTGTEGLKKDEAQLLENDREALKALVRRELTYRPFKDEGEIATALSDAVRQDRDQGKAKLLGAREAMLKQLAAYEQEARLVKNRLLYLVRPPVAAEPTGKDVPAADEAAAEETEQQKAARKATAEKAADEAAEAKIKELKEKSVVSDSEVFRLKNRVDYDYTEGERINLALFDRNTTKENLATWLVTVEDQAERLKRQNPDWEKLDVKKIDELDDAAQRRLQIANLTFRSALEGEGNRARGWSAGRLDIGRVFDENSGAYVIYQTFRTAALVLLVFAVLSIILLLLRVVPAFAGSSGTLMAQIGDVFKSSGSGDGGRVVPQVAKSLVVTAAALGVGTAAVVAGNSISDSRPRVAVAGAMSDDGAGYVAINRRPNGRAGGGAVGGGSGAAGGDGASEVKTSVEFNPYIIHAAPYVIEKQVGGETSGDINWNGGGGGVLTLPQDIVERLRLLTPRPTEPAASQSEFNALRDKVTEINSTVDQRIEKQMELKLITFQSALLGMATKADLENEAQFRGWQFFTFNKRLEGIEQNLGVTLTKLSQELSDANALMAARQNSGGRNILTRTKQFFFNGDRYMVSSQALDALGKLMCGVEPCESEGNKYKKQILDGLREMSGQPPVSGGDFIDALRGKIVTAAGAPLDKKQKDALSKWKSVILKHTRVAY
jgi:hypothetical protein